MCGFVVACQRQNAASDEVVGRALDLLSHRGPDGRNQWRAHGGCCAMGFHRLALVGDASQMQPFHAGGVSLVVNGEIYGHGELRKALTERGARFTTDSDCEVLLHGYRQEGIDFVRRLNGEFSAVLWDEGRRELFAMRDRWGVKPLYYRVTSEGIFLASEVKAFTALGAGLRWNREGLFQHLFAALGPGQTLFEGIFQVPPAHWLKWSEDGLSIMPFRNTLAPVSEPLAAGGAHLLMAQLRDDLDAAVRDRFQGDAPVACYLSGGLDSATMAAIACRHVPGHTLDAFTVSFGADDPDALRAAEVAACLGVRHHVVHVGEAALVEHYEQAAYHAETIGFNAIGSARWILGRAVAEQGFKAVIAGDGADELFGGYGFSVIERLCQLAPDASALSRMLEAGRARLASELGWDGELFELASAGAKAGSAPYLLVSWNYERSGMRQLLAPAFMDAMRGANPFSLLLASVGGMGEGLRSSMDLWQQSLFANHILVAERFDMAHGVETRYPYLDDRVAAVAAQLPDEWLVDQTREKRFLRDAMASVTPLPARSVQKRPFQGPLALFGHDGAFRAYLTDVLQGQNARHSAIFDQRKLLKLLQVLPTLSRESGERINALLMMALSFFVLQRRFCIAD